MIITIYDYGNKPKQIELPDKKISRIEVLVLSGDETGFVEFTDGDRVRFDASDTRCTSYFDGYYIVEGEDIQKWIAYKDEAFCYSGTTSYNRQAAFYKESEDEE